MFTDKDYKFRCRDCKGIKVMPDALNSNIPVIISDDIVIGHFTNVIENAEDCLNISLETEHDRLNEKVRNSVKTRIDEHIKYLEQFKNKL